MGLSIVSIKRSEVEGKNEFEEYIPLMEALGCSPKDYKDHYNPYNKSIVTDLEEAIKNSKDYPKDFSLTEEQEKQIPELEKIIAVCKNWDLYFCIY
jgi:hypothetical protein